MKRLKFWLRRNFNFSQRETNGFLILLLIMVLAIAAPFLFYRSSQSYNPAQDQAALDSLVAQLDTFQANTNARKYAGRSKTEPTTPTKLYLFDPNKLTAAELMELGLSRFAANNIVKYRQKAGAFKYKEQLQRIYGMEPEVYHKLYPYINLPAAQTQNNAPVYADARTNNFITEKKSYKNNVYRLAPFDINSADTTQLKKIRGIGTKLSARIVKFRDKLGGFAHINQLTEVYSLSPEVQDSLRKYTFVQPGFSPKSISINSATLEELRSHPYIGFNLAKLIVAYRTQHGNFQQVDQLKNIKQISEQQFQKLKPYLQL